MATAGWSETRPHPRDDHLHRSSVPHRVPLVLVERHREKLLQSLLAEPATTLREGIPRRTGMPRG